MTISQGSDQGPLGPRAPGPEAPRRLGVPILSRRRSHTPHEIFAYRTESSAPNGPGWSVRVIPEADPYFRIEQELVREGVGLYDRIFPRGATELIVESPSHEDTAATLGDGQWERCCGCTGSASGT